MHFVHIVNVSCPDNPLAAKSLFISEIGHEFLCLVEDIASRTFAIISWMYDANNIIPVLRAQ